MEAIVSSDIERLREARKPTYDRLSADIEKAKKDAQIALSEKIDALNAAAELEILALEAKPEYDAQEYHVSNSPPSHQK
jgi:hypothetical protein